MPDRLHGGVRPMTDPLFDIIKNHWPSIVLVFERFADKNPVILFNVQEQRIYAYPYDDFVADLAAKDRHAVAEQYEKVLAGETILVFVRDNEQRKLVSYSVNREDG